MSKSGLDISQLDEMQLSALERAKLSGERLSDLDTKDLEEMLLEIDGRYLTDTLETMLDNRRQEIEDRVRQRYGSGRQRPEEYHEMRDDALMRRDKLSFFFNSAFTGYFSIILFAGLFLTEAFFFWHGFRFIADRIINGTFTDFLVMGVAVVIILAYFIITWIAHSYRARFGEYKRNRMTFRAIWDGLCYFAGVGEQVVVDYREVEEDGKIIRKPVYEQRPFEYKPVENNPYKSASGVAFTVLVAIVMVSLYSRLHGLIDLLPTVADGTSLVRFQLDYLAQNFGINEIVQIGIVLAVTVGLFKATHFNIEYMHNIYQRAVGEVELDFFDASSVREAKRVEVEKLRRMIILRRLQAHWEKRKDDVLTQYSEMTDNSGPEQEVPSQTPTTESGKNVSFTQAGATEPASYTPVQRAVVRPPSDGS